MNSTAMVRGVAAQTCADIWLKVAATREEREAAFRLTYQSYVRTGLCATDPNCMRFTPFQLLPTTDVFVAQLRGETICTLSLVRDGKLGLPMEGIYGRQVEERRAAGLRLAEVSCLANRRSDMARSFSLFCDLSRVMVQLAERDGIDQLLIAVHPRHAGLYRRYMDFKKIGDRQEYFAVEGNPAVPLCLDLNEGRSNPSVNWKRFFDKRLLPKILKSQPIGNEDRAYFHNLQTDDEYANQSKELQLCKSADTAEFEEGAAVEEEMLCAL